MIRRARRFATRFARRAPLPATALRDALREGYGAARFREDALAGVTVGIVALPLSMALAIASGMAPQHGLYTAIVAGFVIALLGGSRTQVSGPTAAFVVLLAPVSARFGPSGLLVASLLAGVILFAMGLARMGRLIQFIPYPVTTGFTGGIAVVIATLQVKDFLGLTVGPMGESFPERAVALVRAVPTARLPETLMGAATLAILILWPRVTRRVPPALVGLGLAAVAAFLVDRWIPDHRVATIGDRFSYMVGAETRHGIPSLPPLPLLPWNLPAADGSPGPGLSWGLIHALLPAAFAIAMLGAIESLLSAVVADGMAGTRHDPDAELLAQGTGNMLAPFFGGFAATGAVARTATSIRSGARSPVAAMIHAVFVLAAVLLLAPLVAWLPMAALAALLLRVAWTMSEAEQIVHLFRAAPKSDVAVLATTLFLTVMFDMVISVTVGVMLASLLFMRRMAEISGGRLLVPAAGTGPLKAPPGVVVYEIAGPLFFGAAGRAMSSLRRIGADVRAVVFDLSGVPAMDATGLVGLETTLARLRERGVFVVLADVQPQPDRVLRKAGVHAEENVLAFSASRELGLGIAARAAEARG